MVIDIKHMVCPRCISSVKRILTELTLDYDQVTLGQVHLSKKPAAKKFKALEKALKIEGFEWINNREDQLVNRVKNFIIKKIHFRASESGQNLSTELTDLLSMNYATISRTFVRAESITIEKYVIQQKIEKVKELLSYGEKTIAEIAFSLHYSSAAHLSNQFKKVTGISPSGFRQLHKKPRKAISSI